MNTNDIMKMLRDGVSADDIAKKFTEQLNAALEQQKIEEENKKKDAEKIARIEKIEADLIQYMKDYYPDIEFDIMSGKDILDFFDKWLFEPYSRVKKWKI
jgi:adenylosuccinate synthase